MNISISAIDNIMYSARNDPIWSWVELKKPIQLKRKDNDAIRILSLAIRSDLFAVPATLYPLRIQKAVPAEIHSVEEKVS